MRWRLLAVVPILVLSCGMVPAGGAVSPAPESGDLLARRIKPLAIARTAEVCEGDSVRLRQAYARYRGRMDNPALGVVIPLESHPDGSTMVEVQAQKAQRYEVEEEGGSRKARSVRYVLCEDVVIHQYDQAGVVTAELKAPECFIDLQTGSAWMEGKVDGVYEVGYPFSGEGIYFSSNDFFVKLYSKVEITVVE